ncbi:hypothetical protein OAU26_03720 [Mariniblastus sp.]|nr:hypothetical protein [Mariniblastus sp.]
MAVLLATTDKKVVCAKKSWLRDPRYNKEEDENVVSRVNNYFSQFLDAHTHITPNLLFVYGTGTVHYDETHVVNFLQETVKEHPKHLLLQRTSCTSTFDATFFWGSKYDEYLHVEQKYLKNLLGWARSCNIPVLDSAADPVPVEWVRDALQDTTVEEVQTFLTGYVSSDSESDWSPQCSETDSDEESCLPAKKRKREEE